VAVGFTSHPWASYALRAGEMDGTVPWRGRGLHRREAGFFSRVIGFHELASKARVTLLVFPAPPPPAPRSTRTHTSRGV